MCVSVSEGWALPNGHASIQEMTRISGVRASPKRLIPLVLAGMPLLGARAQDNCCVQPYSYFDCTG